MWHPSRPLHQPVFSSEGAEYMNLLYSALAVQGGGSVKAAMSPYLVAMTAPAPAPNTTPPCSPYMTRSSPGSCEKLQKPGLA